MGEKKSTTIASMPLSQEYPTKPESSREIEKSLFNLLGRGTSGLRWSYCPAALANREELGALLLCPMRPKWKPWVLRNRLEIQKSYDIKSGERWITIHPNGEEAKGQPLLIKEHEDGSASVIPSDGEKLNGFFLLFLDIYYSIVLYLGG